MQMPNMATPMGFGPQMVPLTLQNREGLNLMKGQVLNGQILARQGNQTTLQVGKNVLQAENFIPLDVGTQFQFQVKGETSQGQLNIQLLRAQAFSPATVEDLVQTMTGMKIPVNDDNVSLAKGMIEHGLTLTTENFNDMKEALATLPKTLPTDMQAASFLKLSSMPLNQANITTLSQFITSHPLIGPQLFDMQFEFRRLTTGGSTKLSKDMMEMLQKVPGLLGEYILDGKSQSRGKNSQTSQKMARQVGIERTGMWGSGEDEMDLLKMMAAIRKKMAQEKMEGETLSKLTTFMAQIEDNISAQQLINSGKKSEEPMYYYMQIPVRLEGREFTAEIKIYYTTDYNNEKKVDEENTKLEFAVTTENLGELYFQVEIVHGIIHIEVGTEREEVHTFVERYLPALMENVKKLYTPGKARCFVREEKASTPLPLSVKEFDKLERVNLQY
jgi:hypothetical protein